MTVSRSVSRSVGWLVGRSDLTVGWSVGRSDLTVGRTWSTDHFLFYFYGSLFSTDHFLFDFSGFLFSTDHPSYYLPIFAYSQPILPTGTVRAYSYEGMMEDLPSKVIAKYRRYLPVEGTVHIIPSYTCINEQYCMHSCECTRIYI